MSRPLLMTLGVLLWLLSSTSRAGLIYDFASNSDPTTFGYIEIDTTLGGTWDWSADLLGFDVTVDGMNLATPGAGPSGCSGCFDMGPVTPTDPFSLIFNGNPFDGFISLSQGFGFPDIVLGLTEVARLDGQCSGSVVGCWSAVGGTIVRDISWSARERDIPTPSTLALFGIGLLALGRRSFRRLAV